MAVDVPAALDQLRTTVVPNLEASSAFKLDQGDNLKRMAIVREAVDMAAELLELAKPQVPQAVSVLKGPALTVLESSPGYRRAKGRNRTKFGQTKLGIARGGLDVALQLLTDQKKAPKPTELQAGTPTPKRATAPAGVWAQAGVFVSRADNIGGPYLADLLLPNGFRWVAVQIHDGTTPWNEGALAAGWAEQLRSRGLIVGAWGVNRTNPEAEAELAVRIVEQHKLTFYIANAEKEFKASEGDVNLSQRFAKAFRAKLPQLPAAVSSFGASPPPWVMDIDWVAWRDAGFHFLPQAYWNDSDIYEPKACVDHALRAGWSKEETHPTIGIWGGGTSRVVSADEYARSLSAAGTVGFSVYLAEQCEASAWPVLGRAIAENRLAST